MSVSFFRAKVAHGILSGKYATAPQEHQEKAEKQTDQVCFSVWCMCSWVPVTFTAGLLKSQKIDREIFVVNGLLTIGMDPGQVVISLN